MWHRYAVEISYALAREAFEGKDAALARLGFRVTTKKAYLKQPLLLLPRARSKRALVLSRRFAPLFNAAPEGLGPDVFLTAAWSSRAGFSLVARTLSFLSSATFAGGRLQRYGLELFTTYGDRYTRALNRGGVAGADAEAARSAARSALGVKSLRDVCRCSKCGLFYSRRAPAHKCGARV